MNVNAIIDALGNADSRFIETVNQLRTKKKKHVWVRYTAVAACLCLAVVLILPAAFDLFSHKGGMKDEAFATVSLEHSGYVYEVVDDPVILKRYGLPGKITPDLAGEHVDYLKSDGIGYECTPTETDIELYNYAPCPTSAAYVIRDGDKWSAALFSSFHMFDGNTHVEFTELYRVYGAEESGDILSITEMDWYYNPISEPVTDTGQIEEFYNITTNLMSYGREDFDKIQFGDIPEGSQASAHRDFADDMRLIQIETKDGLKFFINVYLSYDWIYGVGAMTYYRSNVMVYKWMDTNFEQ